MQDRGQLGVSWGSRSRRVVCIVVLLVRVCRGKVGVSEAGLETPGRGVPGWLFGKRHGSGGGCILGVGRFTGYICVIRMWLQVEARRFNANGGDACVCRVPHGGVIPLFPRQGFG